MASETTTRKPWALKLPVVKGVETSLVFKRIRKAKKKVVAVRLYQQRQGDLFCVYIVAETRLQPNNLPPGTPFPPLEFARPGDEVCILCVRRQIKCVATMTIRPVRGLEMDLEISPRNQCTHCLTGKTFRRR
jgi:hypothetical protein